MNRELDARVAEKIMEGTPSPNTLPEGAWERVQRLGEPLPDCMLHESGQLVTYQEWFLDGLWRAPEGSYHEHPPAYSSDWAAVGELWEQLCSEQWIMQVTHVDEGECSVRVGECYAEGPFPEALCQAALKAKESEQ